MELFRTFKKYDRNQNGTLEFPEYILCLKECKNLDLSPQEIITVALSGDNDGNGSIDFEEFMKHFQNVLNMTHFNNQLQEQLEIHRKNENVMVGQNAGSIA